MISDRDDHCTHYIMPCTKHTQFFFRSYCLCVCVFASACTAHACSACRGQTRVMDSLGLELQMLLSALWVWLNLGPLEEQSELFTSELPLQPTISITLIN